MSTQPQVYENPFDRPLNSELEESRQRQNATQAASSNGNPFDEPLASEIAEGKHAAAVKSISSNGNPFDEPLASEKAEQNRAADFEERGMYVPNARLRNLTVDPTKDVNSAGEAFLSGAKTGAQAAAIPASAIGLGEAAPYIAHLAEVLPSLDKAYKVVRTLSGVATGTAGTVYTLQHLKDVLKIIGGGSK